MSADLAFISHRAWGLAFRRSVRNVKPQLQSPLCIAEKGLVWSGVADYHRLIIPVAELRRPNGLRTHVAGNSPGDWRNEIFENRTALSLPPERLPRGFSTAGHSSTKISWFHRGEKWLARSTFRGFESAIPLPAP